MNYLKEAISRGCGITRPRGWLVTSQAINSIMAISCNTTTPGVPDGFGSTHLNSRIESYADLVYRIKAELGDSLPEVSDEHFAIFIDDAIDRYSEWAGFDKTVMLVNDRDYKPGCGIDLSSHTNDYGCGCGCPQYCIETVSATCVSSYDCYEHISVECGLLSVSPVLSSLSGQKISVTFDDECPWQADNICDANCFTIRPKGYKNYLDMNTTDIPFLSAGPLSAMAFSSIPLSALDADDFYPEPTLIGPELSGCLNISAGKGAIYPDCLVSNIKQCDPLSAIWGIPSKYYDDVFHNDVFGLSCKDLSAGDVDCDCRCATEVKGRDNFCLQLSTVHGWCDQGLYGLDPKDLCSKIPFLSANCAGVFDDTPDIDDAKHFTVKGLPKCYLGPIPLDENRSGVVGTFTLCNAKIDTCGPREVGSIQFMIDHSLPQELMGTKFCSACNTIFTLTVTGTECYPHTPCPIEVELAFDRSFTKTVSSISTSTVSSNFDTSLGDYRRVNNVYEVNPPDYHGSDGYGFGSGLFSFDAAIASQAFGNNGNGGTYGGLVTYHLGRQMLEQVRRMLRYVSYEFNKDTQMLKIVPEPRGCGCQQFSGCPCEPECDCRCESSCGGGRCYVIGVYLEKRVVDMLSKHWVQRWVKMRAMMAAGLKRQQFGTLTLLGGATVAGDTLVSIAQAEETTLLEELRDQIRTQSQAVQFFVG